MQLFSILLSATLFIATAVAQLVTIGSPSAGASVKAGSNITVDIQHPRDLQRALDVSVVIGLLSCPDSPCPTPDENMGTILFLGPYNPDNNLSPPSQNFTVNIPMSAQKGQAQLGIAHLALTGAGQVATLETLSVTVNVD